MQLRSLLFYNHRKSADIQILIKYVNTAVIQMLRLGKT